MVRTKLVLSAAIFLLLLPGRVVFAAEDLNSVLAKLDAAAARFHTTTADFEFDTVQTQPVPDTDVQKGMVGFQRTGTTFQMGVHINQVNGQTVPKVIVCCTGGSVKMYEKLVDQVTTLSKLSQYESLFMLGFGASGKELAEKWDIKYDGAETIDGVQTAKLEMVPKDPAVRKNIQKVTLWMDTDHGVSLRQRFDEGPDQYRTCHYFNFKLNQPLPKDAFTLPTDKATTYVSH
jgi:outer membrane lipoprotein-sorting protein